ncbi:MAG: hypothetical protein KJ955_03535 [Nanoarchaeota archaeon]|nr:hypothetical protein [Nanoarchaeota archaeon]
MFGKRGQAGIEYVMIVGAILLVTIPLFFYAFYETNKKVALNQAEDAVNTIAKAADTVYSLGPGSKKYVWVSIPSGVVSSSLNSSEVMLVFMVMGKQNEIYASTRAVLVGSVPVDKGTYRIAVESLDAGLVRIGEVYNDTTPPVILRVYPDPLAGQTVCPGFVTIGADTDEPAMCRYANGSLTGYGSMASLFDGRGLTHISTLYLESSIEYTYYASCSDYFGNTMNASSMINFVTSMPCGAEGTGSLTVNLSDEQVPPVVHLIAPPDEYVRNFSWLDLSYSVFDANSSIDYCLLIASGINYLGEQRVYFGWQNQPSENSTNNMTLMIEKGNYSWYVNCTDSSTNHNIGRSAETWSFVVTKTFYESFLNSCAGECGFAGFLDGFCRENVAQCTNKDEVHLESADEKCLTNNNGDPSRDTCCCVPG